MGVSTPITRSRERGSAYPSFSAASRTARRASAETRALQLIAREAVPIDTPAETATSCRVGFFIDSPQ